MRVAPLAARGGVNAPAAASALPATGLPQPTRQFLRPIVGFDPATVPVYSGPRAAELAAHLGADALATDGAIVLGAAHQPEATDPPTLGVLAHELTHVARRREPRFIPPIARTPSTPAPSDEEGLARRVEARTVRAARDEPTPPAAPPPSGDTSPRGATPVPAPVTEVDSPAIASLATTAGAAPAVPAEPAATMTATPLSFDGSPVAADRDEWNGLPAPWEPLPAWLQAPASTGPTAASVVTVIGAGVSGPAFAADSSPTVSLAETGRTLDTGDTDAAGDAPKPAGAAPPEPDLDALARQVYSIVRRRLAADDRRAR